MPMTIYTKIGDKGKTKTLFSGNTKVSKGSPTIQAIGAIDEVNSYIGLCVALMDTKMFVQEKTLLEGIQNNLFITGASFAGSKKILNIKEVKKLEAYIDSKEKKLPVLKNFILPGGNVLSSHLMYARSITRSAERSVVVLSEKRKIDSTIIVFLNRLSDALFIMARYVNYKNRVKEKVWAGSDK